MALRKSIARNSTTGISSGLIQTIEFEEDFVDAIEGVSINMNPISQIMKSKEFIFDLGWCRPCRIHGIWMQTMHLDWSISRKWNCKNLRPNGHQNSQGKFKSVHHNITVTRWSVLWFEFWFKLGKVDVKEFKKLAKKEKVKAMPTFVFYKGGERVESFAGASPQRIVEILDDLLGIEKPKPEEEPENAVPKGLPPL